jgi:hypothetical protein
MPSHLAGHFYFKPIKAKPDLFRVYCGGILIQGFNLRSFGDFDPRIDLRLL